MHASIALGVSQEPFEHALDEARAPRRDGEGHRPHAPERRGAEARASPTPTSPPRSCARSSRAFKAIVKKETGKRLPDRPARAALAGHRGGLPLVEQPPRHRLPPDARHPRRLGHRVQRAGDGLRQPGRHERHRRRLHARPVDGREEALRRVAARTRRARTSSPASARRMPIRVARAADADESLETKMPEAYRELVAHRADAREALPRHAGPRVHHPGRQALHAAVPHRRSARRAPRCASRSTWRRRGSSRRRRPCCASTRARSTSSSTRRSIRTRRSGSSRAASPASPGRGAAGTSSSAPTRPSGAPGRASRSSWCASRPRPRTSTA